MNDNVNSFKKNFANEIKRLQMLERQLRYFEAQLLAERTAVTGRRLFDFEPHPYSPLAQKPKLDELEQKFDELESELRQINTNKSKLDGEWHRCVEWKYALLKAAPLIEQVARFFKFVLSFVKQMQIYSMATNSIERTRSTRRRRAALR